jgi:hypothetical protein
MEANFTKEEIRALRLKVNALRQEIEDSIGESQGMTIFELDSYNRLINDLFHASHALHKFWEVAKDKKE